jgi:hypothetical protein
LNALVRAIESELQESTRRKGVVTGDEGNIRSVFEFYRELLEGKIE